MIDLGALGFRSFRIVFIVFLFLSGVFYFALSPEVKKREYVSVFLVGKRSIDTPIDKPEQLAEYARLKLLPAIGKEFMGGQWSDVQVVFTNKPGSRFIRIITYANEVYSEDVERVHRGLLKALLSHQEQRLLLIRRNLVSVISIEKERLDLGGAYLSDKKKADIKATIYSITDQLDNLESSEIVEPFSIGGVDKLYDEPVRAVFSLLLAILFVSLFVFFYALLSARINTVSVENIR